MANDIRITLETGKGLLDARALWASTVGPYRLAMAQRQTVMLNNTNALEVAKNLGASDCYVFVGLALPVNAPMLSLPLFLGRENDLGTASWAAQLTRGAGNLYPVSFLLAPGEQLFAQIADIAVASQNVVSAAVVF